MAEGAAFKPVEWVGSSHDDLSTMPSQVRSVFGFAIYLAQVGRRHVNAKPLKGFGGAGVVEVVANHDR